MKYADINESYFSNSFENCQTWSLSREQFEQLQNCISGARMPTDGNITNLDNWLVSRDEYLISCENEQGYQSYDWCHFGKFSVDGYVNFWYETTRGTIFTIEVSEDNSILYWVSLPLDRCSAERYHYTEILLVLAGRTLEQSRNWYDCFYNSEHHEHYPEFAKFHNEHLVRQGFKPYPSSFEEYKAINTLKTISDIGVYKNGQVCHNDIERVRSYLKTAAKEWDTLFPPQQQPNDDSDYENYDDSDYEDYEDYDNLA